MPLPPSPAPLSPRSSLALLHTAIVPPAVTRERGNPLTLALQSAMMPAQGMYAKESTQTRQSVQGVGKNIEVRCAVFFLLLEEAMPPACPLGVFELLLMLFATTIKYTLTRARFVG